MAVPAPPPRFDAFLSHASPDKGSVRALGDELAKLGVTAYLDEKELVAGRNFVLSLDGGLADSRFLVLVLSQHTLGHEWVLWEWSTFMAGQGPVGRVVPVRLDDVPLPHALAAVQPVSALDQDAASAAAEIARRVADPDRASIRSLYVGRHLVAVLSNAEAGLTVRDREGAGRTTDDPRRSGAFNGDCMSFAAWLALRPAAMPTEPISPAQPPRRVGPCSTCSSTKQGASGCGN